MLGYNKDMIKKNQTINFKARSKTEGEVQLRPYPAVKNLPDWFTNAKPYSVTDSLTMINGVPNFTFKKCTPMLDGMSAGYIIPLWTDIFIEIKDNNPIISWKNQNAVFEIHGIDSQNITPPPGYTNLVFKYLSCWIPETPKGYSCIFVPPLGHHDIPFRPIPAIVDTDRSKLEIVQPMWLQKDFTGIVEKGTPLVQVIPFKRDDWNSTFDYYEDGYYHNVVAEKNFRGTIVGNYIKNHWSKKRFT